MNPTVNTFECFVDLYDVKYKLSLSNVKPNVVSFCRLYEEIIKIDPKHDISFQTNTFEVWDNDHQGFKRITSFGQLIGNESRIRVLLKPVVFHNYLADYTAADANPSVTSTVVTDSRIHNYVDSDYRVHKGLDQSVDTKSTSNSAIGYGGSSAGDNGRTTTAHLLPKSFIDNKSISFYAANVGTNMSDSNDRWIPSTASTAAALAAAVTGARAAAAATLPMATAAATESPMSSLAMGPSVRVGGGADGDGAAPDVSQTYCPTNVIDYQTSGDNNYETLELTSDQTPIAKELDLNLIKSIIESQIQATNKEKLLNQLREEGVQMKQNFNFEIYLCKVCDECFQTPDSALTHTQTADHTANKSGNFSDDLDKQLVIETDRLKDIAVVLARKQEMRKLDLKTKYQYLRHGIRIKDGTGDHAFVCLSCNESFVSSNYVRHHLKKFEPTTAREHESVYCSTTFNGITQSQAKPFSELFVRYKSCLDRKPKPKPTPGKSPSVTVIDCKDGNLVPNGSSGNNNSNNNNNKRRRNRKRKRSRRSQSPDRKRLDTITDKKVDNDRKNTSDRQPDKEKDRQKERDKRDADRKEREKEERGREKERIKEIERREKDRRERRDRSRERRERRDNADREFSLY